MSVSFYLMDESAKVVGAELLNVNNANAGLLLQALSIQVVDGDTSGTLLREDFERRLHTAKDNLLLSWVADPAPITSSNVAQVVTQGQQINRAIGYLERLGEALNADESDLERVAWA